jgi:hypothetical protein
MRVSCDPLGPFPSVKGALAMPRAPRTVSACPILRPQRAPWPWRKRRRSTSRSATKPAPSRSWRRRSRPIRPASKLGWPKPKSTSPPVNTTQPSPPASRPSRCARRTSTSTPRCPASGWSGATRPRPSITAPRRVSLVGATSSRNRKVSSRESCNRGHEGRRTRGPEDKRAGGLVARTRGPEDTRARGHEDIRTGGLEGRSV